MTLQQVLQPVVALKLHARSSFGCHVSLCPAVKHPACKPYSAATAICIFADVPLLSRQPGSACLLQVIVYANEAKAKHCILLMLLQQWVSPLQAHLNSIHCLVLARFAHSLTLSVSVHSRPEIGWFSYDSGIHATACCYKLALVSRAVLTWALKLAGCGINLLLNAWPVQRAQKNENVWTEYLMSTQILTSRTLPSYCSEWLGTTLQAGEGRQAALFSPCAPPQTATCPIAA